MLLPNAVSVPFAFSRNSSMPDWFARTTSVPEIATSPDVPLSAAPRLVQAVMAPVALTAQLSRFVDVDRNTRPGAGKARAHPTVLAMPPGDRPALNVSMTEGLAGVVKLTRWISAPLARKTSTAGGGVAVTVKLLLPLIWVPTFTKTLTAPEGSAGTTAVTEVADDTVGAGAFVVPN